MGTKAILADIGGTNARFAMLDEAGNISQLKILPTEKYTYFADAFRDYLQQINWQGAIEKAVFCVGAPVAGDLISFPNSHWHIKQQEISTQFNIQKLKIINDFTAVALSLPHIPEGSLVKIGEGEIVGGNAKAVLGPGTGLGVGGLVPDGKGGWSPISGEGGHVTLPCVEPREFAIVQQLLAAKYSHVSAERLVSGKGIVNMYNAICAIEGEKPLYESAEEISAHGVSAKCKICAEVMERFCAMLGTVAGNLALTLGARGGVYIAGGITPKILDYFKASQFRTRFENKGRSKTYMALIPTYIITYDNPSFLGLKALAEQI